jgi:hypothetical protein
MAIRQQGGALLEELHQREALFLGIFKRFLQEDDKVVRVAHHVEARPTTLVVGLQALLRPLAGLIAWVGNQAPVSLVDGP